MFNVLGCLVSRETIGIAPLVTARAADRLRERDNTAGIGDNSAGIVDIAAKVIPC